MSVHAEHKDAQNAIITITIEPKDYKPEAEKELKRYAQVANVPGFRKGQAPMGMIRRMAGKSVALDAVTKVISDKLYHYIQENKLDILGKPLPVTLLGEEDVDANCSQNVVMAFELGFAPTFDLKLESPNPPVHYTIDIDDTYLDDRIKDLQRRYGNHQVGEEIQEGDWIFGKLQEVDLNQTPVEGGFHSNILLNPERLSNPLIFAPLYGMKIDESKHLDLNVFSDMDLDNIGISAGLKAEDFVPLKEKSTLFTIKRISRTTPAELNKEFFGKVLGVSAEANTEEEFRAIAKGQLEEGLAQQESTRFSEAAREELLKINDFSMPDEFLKKWMLSEKTEKTEAAVIEQEYEKYQSFFRWEMIENKLQEMNPDIIPTAATVEHRAKIGIAEYAKAEGQELDIDLVYNNLKKEKEFMKKQFETLKEENLRNFLEIAVPHQHVHITATEYEAKFLQS